MRGATLYSQLSPSNNGISIHASHAGSDFTLPCPKVTCGVFQSTLPMRGATLISRRSLYPMCISIHAPHAGSDRSADYAAERGRNFNPRSPCGERPFSNQIYCFCKRGFQSTLPMRGATVLSDISRSRCAISIHAPHAGSDNTSCMAQRGGVDFNPRSPCGERPTAGAVRYPTVFISIHAPHAGSDALLHHIPNGGQHFNPRSPCGERRAQNETDF